MKKTVFLALMVCGLVASFLVGNSMSQAPPDGDAEAADPPKRVVVDSDEPAIFKLQFRRNLDLIDDISPRIESLRNQLLELTQKRIKTMTEEELKAEMARLQKLLAGEKAEKKLQQAQSLLREIVKEYPESRAAKRANMMLKSLHGIEAAEPGPRRRIF
jgi:TolA-binding protein